MKAERHLLWAMSIVLIAGLTNVGVGVAADAAAASQILYSFGSQQSFTGPEKYFTGKVQVDMLFPGNDTAHYSGAYVTFAPGARTAWHRHPSGQHMIVTRGIALTGTRDGKVIEFKAGETVWCPPNIDHWHGATPDAPMTHLVITGSKDGKNVIWKGKVSDAEYLGGELKGSQGKVNHQQESINQKEKAMANIDALSVKQRGIIPIAAFTANGDLENLKTAIVAGLNDGLSINEIKEVQIQLYAYAGFPRALNGLATLMGVVKERKAKGINDPTGKEANPFLSDKNSLEVGTQVQTELSGKPVTGPLFDFAPAINKLLQRHLFGDLFARGILDYQSREIVTLSALASMDGVDSQLKAHIRIATNVGLTKTQLGALAVVLRQAVGKQEGERAEHAIQEILPNQAERA